MQFWILTFASLALLKTFEDLPRAFVLLTFAWFCYSLFVLGAWLEGRDLARRLEWLRVGLTSVLGMAGYLLWPQQLTLVAVAMTLYSVVSGVALFVEHVATTHRKAAVARA